MSDDAGNELDEQALQRLLLTTPEPELTEAQRNRLRSRLGFANDIGAFGVEEVGAARQHSALTVVEVPPSDPESMPSRTRSPRWRRVIAWAAVATVVVGAGVALATRGAEPDRTLLAGDGTPTPSDAAVISFCQDHAATFADAIVVWDGVENWGFLTDRRLPQPDLLTEARDTVAALVGITASPDAQQVLSTLDVLLDDDGLGPAATPPFGWTSSERADRVDAVTAAAEVTEVTIRERGWSEIEGCAPVR